LNKAAAYLITTLALVLGQVASTAASPDEDFREANQLFETREYERAITLYTSIVQQGLESPALYFNLGNAYFRNGDLGHAVLYYLRAKRLSPGDDDIAANLQFARSFTRVQMEGVRLNPVQSLLESILEPYRLNSLAWASSLVFILVLSLLTVRYGLGVYSRALRSAVIALFCLLVVFSSLTTFKYRNDYLTHRAVVIAEDCSVRTGPSDQSDIELEAAPGLVVEILSESSDYFNVLFENKRRGWIQKELLAVL